MSTKLIVALTVILGSAQVVFTAPHFFNWRQLGRDAVNVGRQAIPVVKSGCQLLNGHQIPPQVYYVNVPYQYPQYPSLDPRNNVPVQYNPVNVPNNNPSYIANNKFEQDS